MVDPAVQSVDLSMPPQHSSTCCTRPTRILDCPCRTPISSPRPSPATSSACGSNAATPWTPWPPAPGSAAAWSSRSNRPAPTRAWAPWSGSPTRSGLDRPAARLRRDLRRPDRPAEQAVRLWNGPGGGSGTLLGGAEAPGPLELWSWRLHPGESHASDPHPPGTVEIARVDEGVLTLTLDGREHRVPAGATASYEAGTAHGYRNDGDAPCLVTMVVSVPPPGA